MPGLLMVIVTRRQYYQQLEKPTLPQRDFNHAIGLPTKNGNPMPLFDYEQLLFDTLQTL
jgi:hypothetical protein